MLSRPVSRAGCPGCSRAWGASLAICTSTPGVAARPSCKSVQRRLSSSKVSCPPGSSRTGSESATSGAQNTGGSDTPEQATTPKEKRSATLSRRKLKYSAASADTLEQENSSARLQNDAFATAPAVPPTNHLHENDVKLSSFFALHRPMSIHTVIPPPTTSSSFATIFQQPSYASKWKPADVIYTLNTAVMNLEGSSDPQTLHESVVSQSASHSGETQPIRGPSGVSLDEMMKKFRPFNKPPVPIPLDPKYQRPHHRHDQRLWHPQTKQQRDIPGTSQQPHEKKTFTTTVYISESTDMISGAKTYTASATPIVEQKCSEIRRHAHQSFLSRMRARGNAQYNALVNRVHSARNEPGHELMYQVETTANRGKYARVGDDTMLNQQEQCVKVGRDMLLLSVKRRRKLKMKKHKYKKLMRRTRNARRREGRT